MLLRIAYEIQIPHVTRDPMRGAEGTCGAVRAWAGRPHGTLGASERETPRAPGSVGPMRNPMRDPGSRSSPWFYERLNGRSVMQGTGEELNVTDVHWGVIGSLPNLLKSTDTRNDICIPVTICNHRRDIY